MSDPEALKPLQEPDTAKALAALIDREIERVQALADASEAEKQFELEQGEKASHGAELAKCADGVKGLLHWFEHWAWTYDPRLIPEGKSPFIRFKPWPKQKDFLRWLHARVMTNRPWLLEKSRDQGATYLLCGFAVWAWRFMPGFKTTFGSRDEDLVDNRDNPDAIFEKLRIILRRLPVWMLPEGFDFRKHDTIMQLTNPANGATITGEGGDEMGRGGRSTLYVLDEAAFVKRAGKVEAALSGNVDCVGWVSSVNPSGDGNFFFTKRTMMPADSVFRLHWRDDPRKDDAWAEWKKNSLSDPSTWDAEYEIDYHAAKEGMCIPSAWVQSAVRLGALCPDLPRGKIGISGGDVGGGKAKSVVMHRFGPIVLKPLRRSQGDTTGTAFWMMEECAKAESWLLNFDSVGIGQGVLSTLSQADQASSPDIKAIAEKLTRRPINTGVPATNRKWPDGRTSEEMFGNLKAEIWWLCRQAFQRTHSHVLFIDGKDGGEAQKLDELISIPNDASLIMQLSVVKWARNEKGKIIIESKDSLARRGVPSPDDADALVLTFLEAAGDGIPDGMRFGINTELRRPNPFIGGSSNS